MYAHVPEWQHYPDGNCRKASERMNSHRLTNRHALRSFCFSIEQDPNETQDLRTRS